jgi:septal ring factor EnvC (AmiA/AmiB activator)
MLGLFGSSEKEDKVMGSFILTEIRDLRKGMEGRDGELRGEIAAVRDAVATLSESVSRSHTKVESIKGDVDSISTDVRRLRQDVDDIQKSTHIREATEKSEWAGPKKMLGIVLALGSGAGAITVLAKFWPVLLALAI